MISCPKKGSFYSLLSVIIALELVTKAIYFTPCANALAREKKAACFPMCIVIHARVVCQSL